MSNELHQTNIEGQIQPISILEGVIEEIGKWEEKNLRKAYFGLPDRNKIEAQQPQNPSRQANIGGGDDLFEEVLDRASGFVRTAGDAFSGKYGGRETGVALNSYVKTGIESICDFDTATMIRTWLHDKSKSENRKLKHSEVFGLLLDVENGDITAAVRDTMLFFNVEFRDPNSQRTDFRDRSLLQDFYVDILEPINPFQPFPQVHDKENPDSNINNRVGEYYHQYWLLFLLQQFDPQVVKTMLDGEYFIFGKRHGEIKKTQDYKLIDDYTTNKDNLSSNRPQLQIHSSEKTCLAKYILGDLSKFTIREDYQNGKTPIDTNFYTGDHLVTLDSGLFHIVLNYNNTDRTVQVAKLQRADFLTDDANSIHLSEELQGKEREVVYCEFVKQIVPHIKGYDEIQET